MIALVDIDSLFYKACYKLDDLEFIEKCGLANEDLDTIIGSLAEIGSDRLERMLNDILLDIENDPHDITIASVEIYVTNCKNSIRKQISPEYKANRVPNLIVNCLRSLYIFKNEAIYSDTLEADDLIADRAKSMKQNEYIVISMDKDLTQIPGFRYDFYKKPSKRDESGNETEIFPCRGLSYTSDWEAQKFLAKQMIMGDSGDRIKGLPKYGEVKASKLIDCIHTPFGLKRTVLKEYKKVFDSDYMEQLQLNFRLLYLGSFSTNQ